MRLPITTTNTSYVEFDTPTYYRSKWGNCVNKIYDTGIISVYTEQICNFYLESNDIIDKYVVDKIRELLETGIPITKQEFDEQFTITINHLNIISQ